MTLPQALFGGMATIAVAALLVGLSRETVGQTPMFTGTAANIAANNNNSGVYVINASDGRARFCQFLAGPGVSGGRVECTPWSQ